MSRPSICAFLATGDAAFGATPFAEVTTAGFTSNATEVRIGATSGPALSATYDDVAIDTLLLAGQSVYATTKTTDYAYDGLNRLTEERMIGTPDIVTGYSYDRAGNRLTAGTSTWSYNTGNQVTNAGWSYDEAGNLTNDGTDTYTYDALNRMTWRNGTTTRYDYTGDGVLVSETTGSTTTRYTQDLAAPLSQVLQTRVGAGAWTSYLYGHERLASLASPRAWYLTDALGTVRRTVSDAGAIQGTASYTAWGVPQGSLIAPFGFTGELQSGAGLTYLRARWYNAASGRFGSRDPFAGFAEQPYSLHSYQYGYANPVLYTDPSGRCVDSAGNPVACTQPPNPSPTPTTTPTPGTTSLSDVAATIPTPSPTRGPCPPGVPCGCEKKSRPRPIDIGLVRGISFSPSGPMAFGFFAYEWIFDLYTFEYGEFYGGGLGAQSSLGGIEAQAYSGLVWGWRNFREPNISNYAGAGNSTFLAASVADLVGVSGSFTCSTDGANREGFARVCNGRMGEVTFGVTVGIGITPLVSGGGATFTMNLKSGTRRWFRSGASPTFNDALRFAGFLSQTIPDVPTRMAATAIVLYNGIAWQESQREE